MSLYQCRFCGSELKHSFVDLGATPLANSFLAKDDLDSAELFLSLHARVCEECYLVQLPALETPEKIFSNYLYFSSYSETWLEHARAYTEAMVERFDLDKTSHVVEIAGNDGYLLQYFKEKDVPILSIEPAANVADVAMAKGIPTVIKFFGRATAQELVSEGKQADLTVANNVLAHVPDINDFVGGFAILLKPEGVATFEFPHLLNLVQKNQFDTIYHEHYSYLSLTTVERIFESHGLSVFDVEQLSTHGGSLRVFAQRSDSCKHERSGSVSRIIEIESNSGLADIERLSQFGEIVKRTKRDLIEKLIELKNNGKNIVAYGAAAKGNTLLNYCGIKTDFLDYVCDANPNKQSLYLPGTRVPIVGPQMIVKTRPDYVLILPWNLADEVIDQNEYIREWDGKFIVPIPSVKIF